MLPIGKFFQFKVNTKRFEDQWNMWNTGKNTLYVTYVGQY